MYNPFQQCSDRLPVWGGRAVCAVLLASSLLLPVARAAVVISNTAQADFTDPSNSAATLLSNGGVAVDIVRLRLPEDSSLVFYKYSPSGQCANAQGRLVPAQSLLVAGGQYEDAGGTLQPLAGPLILPVPGSGGAPVPLDVSGSVNVCPSTVFHEGEPVFISLEDHNRNADPALVETIRVTLSSNTGDVDEVLELRETGPNTGIFAAVIQSTTASVQQGDGKISVGVDGWVRGYYQDPLWPTDESRAEALVDPFGILFDAGTGQPISNATLWLIDQSLPGCAGRTVADPEAILDACGADQSNKVFMDDGVTPHPAKVTTGVTVPGNPAVPAGGFRFPLMVPGNYRFIVKPPAGYAVPSTTLPACASPPCANAFGRSIVAGSHLQPFVVVPGPALNIDIPADPSQDALTLVKTVSTTEAQAGDFLQYRLQLSNRSAGATLSTGITDVLPVGMRYQSGSLARDGVTLPDPVIQPDGRTLMIAAGALNGSASTTISYVVKVTADAVVGQAVNTAGASGPTGHVNGQLVSNRAQAAVRIREFLLSGRFTLIGRVFESQDCSVPFAQQKGVPNVRILLEDGTYVVTDKDGQYHIEGIKPGTHVVQMDVATLPLGAEPVSCLQNTRFAGSAYSQFVDVKGGGLWRADFHVRPVPVAAVPSAPATPVILEGEAGLQLMTMDDVQVTDLTQELTPRSYTFYGRFASGQDVLLPESVTQLEKMAADLKRGKAIRLEVLGHTDSQKLSARSRARFGDNHGLGLARAKMIASYLAQQLDMPADRVFTQGVGPDRPLASNDSAAGMAKNRRVEVIVYGGMGPSTIKVGERSRRQHQVVVDTANVSASNLRVTVMLPPDLSFVKGSAMIDGASLTDPDAMEAGILVWRNIPGRAPVATLTLENDGLPVPAEAGQSTAAADLTVKQAVGWRRAITFQTDVVNKVVTNKAPADKTFTFKGNFAPAQATLEAESVDDLERLQDALRRAGTIERLTIVGHTDNQKLSARARQRYPDNKALSLARADTIADYLATGLGLARDRITIEGQGPDSPVASNATPVGMAQNRRVEVSVFTRESATPYLQRLCVDGYVSLKAMAVVDTEVESVLRLPVVENRLSCAGQDKLKPTVQFGSQSMAGAGELSAASGLAAVEKAASPVVAGSTMGTEQASTTAAVPEGFVANDVTIMDSGRQRIALKPAPPERPKSASGAPAVALDPEEVDALNTDKGSIDWTTRATGKTGILFPTDGFNPRAPALHVVVEHQNGQMVELRVNDEATSALNFEGSRRALRQNTKLMFWRSLPLKEGPNQVVARVHDINGSVTDIVRTVYFSNTPARAELVPAKSKLVADGITRPAIAVRMLDRYGQPVRDGVSGDVSIQAPYMSWQQHEETQRRQLAGLDRFQPKYMVKGDDGIALIELAPTTDSGMAQISFEFPSETGSQSNRRQELRAWLEPAAREWVMVGFAEGTVGYNTLKDNVQTLIAQGTEDGSYTDGKVSFYAKGSVLGKWLLTMAYDTSKQRDRQSLLSTIDPDEYYTLYGDGAEQRYDAASQSKLYLKLEKGQFYALFGDYDTGLNQTELSRYNRTLNGLKTEKADGMVVFTAYAADTQQNYARDDIRGNGTSGLYRLTQNNIVLNSEQIRLETRDRLHSQTILDSKTLIRHFDYDIDYSAGTLFFKQPILSNDASFNPIWIVAEYETTGMSQQLLNAGGRVGLNLKEGRLAVGLTALHDESSNLTSQSRTNLTGADMKYRFALDTELRLEAAETRGDRGGVDQSGGGWLAELEHHSGRYDLLLYSRGQSDDFGVGQQSLSESGQTKTGATGAVHLNREWSVRGELFQQDNASTDSTRQAAATKLSYDTKNGSAAIGVQVINDSTDTGALAGQDFSSEQLTLEASRRLLQRKLELSAQAEVGQSDSADYPNRLVLNGSYALKDNVRLLAGQEFTDGSDLETSTSRVGVQVVPWKGARMDSTLNQSRMSEYGPRTFAQYGLSQSLVLNKQWGLDLAVDSSQSIGSQQAVPQINNSTATSNILGVNSNSRVTAVTEDYWAMSAGATYRADIWSWTNRLESRNGETEDRYGLTSNFLRQARDGVAFASGLQAFHTESATGASGNLASLDLSWAWRPLGTQWSVLDRLEFKYEDAESTVALVAPPSGGILGQNSLVANDARSRRIINNVSLNRVSREWAGEDRTGNLFRRYERNQWSLYYGAKYALDTFDGLEYSGYTDMMAIEVRHDVRPWLDVGLQASTLNSWNEGAHAYSFGPQVGVSPVKNGWITLGWNLRGFSDRDFDAARYSAQGPYLQLRLKFDQNTRLNRDIVAPNPAMAEEPL